MFVREPDKTVLPPNICIEPLTIPDGKLVKSL